MAHSKLGSHVSYDAKKGLIRCVEEAFSYGGNTFMFYTGAPQNTIRSAINQQTTKEAHELMIKYNINKEDVLAHAPYLINLANPKLMDFSISFLVGEMKRCNELSINYLIIHPGSHVGLGIQEGIKNIVFALNKVFEKSDNKIMILLESMSGKGSEIGSNFLELKQIIDGITQKNRIGICLDTCHLNDSGYDLTNFDQVLDEFDKIIGLDKLKCLHLNDSKNPLASKKDRHENIGYGTIGFKNLISILNNERIKHVPKILETPYINDKPPYKAEIDMLKSKIFNEKLKDNE